MLQQSLVGAVHKVLSSLEKATPASASTGANSSTPTGSNPASASRSRPRISVSDSDSDFEESSRKKRYVMLAGHFLYRY